MGPGGNKIVVKAPLAKYIPAAVQPPVWQDSGVSVGPSDPLDLGALTEHHLLQGELVSRHRSLLLVLLDLLPLPLQ